MKSKASSRTSKLKVRRYILLMLGIAGSLLQPGLQTFALAAGVRSTGADTSDTPANRARADWWSFKPAIRPSVPEIASAKFIIRNPVDNFVIARLTELKLAPSPEADRRTLIRRATFDLIGLPPSPADIDAFVNDPEVAIAVCSLTAAGVGINLQVASNIVLAELSWTDAEQTQAIDRSHRIGQTEPVTAWRIIAAQTIDARIAELIDSKAGLAARALDGSDDEVSSSADVQLEALVALLTAALTGSP